MNVCWWCVRRVCVCRWWWWWLHAPSPGNLVVELVQRGVRLGLGPDGVEPVTTTYLTAPPALTLCPPARPISLIGVDRWGGAGAGS